MSGDGSLAATAAWMRAQVGYREGHGNRNKYSAALGRPPEFWCSDFVVAGLRAAGVRVIASSAFTPTAEAQYKKAGRLGVTPRVGAQFFVFTPKMGRITHTGWVYKVAGDYVYTIEGNSNDDGSANGDGVYKRHRRARRRPGRAGIRSYGYPHYQRSTKTGPAATTPARKRPRQSLLTKRKVKKLQKLLKVTCDGGWGSETDAAAVLMWNAGRRFTGNGPTLPVRMARTQRIVGVRLTGTFDAATRTALIAWVKQLQRLLGVKDDGEFGRNTNKAFQAFRKKAHIF